MKSKKDTRSFAQQLVLCVLALLGPLLVAVLVVNHREAQERRRPGSAYDSYHRGFTEGVAATMTEGFIGIDTNMTNFLDRVMKHRPPPY